jgi:hypothetical protein
MSKQTQDPAMLALFEANRAKSEQQERALIDEFEAYCAAQGLISESADDMLRTAKLTHEQRAWLKDFCVRWDAVYNPY